MFSDGADVCGTWRRQGYERRLKALLAAQQRSLQAPPPASGAGAGVRALVGAARKIKLSLVIDQSLDAEITPLSSLEVRQLFDAYKGTHGDYPVEDVEATADQISGVQQLVRQD